MRVVKRFLGLLAAVSLVVGLGGCSSADRGLEKLRVDLIEVGSPIVDAFPFYTKSGLTRILNVALTIDSERVGGDTLKKVFNIVYDAKLKKYVTMDFYLRDPDGEVIDILPEEVDYVGVDTTYLDFGTLTLVNDDFDDAVEAMR